MILPKIQIGILCGGLGERMGNYAKECQKCMIKIDEKPILEYILDQIINAFGEANIFFLTGHRHRILILCKTFTLKHH